MTTERHGEDAAFCTGEFLCAGCAWCRDCERFVGQPHVAVCACPPGAEHVLCPSCAAKSAAWALTAGEHEEGHWFDETVAAYEARIEGTQPIDPAQWLVYVGGPIVCGGCRTAVLIEPDDRDGALGMPTSLALVLDAVSRHLHTCERAGGDPVLELDMRRVGRGSSFGIKGPSESGR